MDYFYPHPSFKRSINRLDKLIPHKFKNFYNRFVKQLVKSVERKSGVSVVFRKKIVKSYESGFFGKRQILQISSTDHSP